MTTLQYTGYRQDQFDDQEYPMHAAGHGKGVAGLSPFDVPEGIEINTTEGGEAVFTFRYPDRESHRPVAVAWPGPIGVSVVLGFYSSRILKLQVSAAETILAIGPLRLDPRGAWSWLRDVPDSTRIAAQRNAEVIARIMGAIPDAVREAIVASARDSRTAANRTISRW